MKNNSAFEKALAVVCVALLLVFLGFLAKKYTAVDTLEITNVSETDTDKKVTVKFTGEIKNRGEYSVSSGTPISEAIYEAGGVSDDADLSDIDIDKLISEPCTINIPKAGKNKTAAASGYKSEQKAGSSGEFRCNLNSALKDELTQIPGVGDKTADAIIKYREANGGFKSIDEIKQIKGIGTKKFEKMQAYITV